MIDYPKPSDNLKNYRVNVLHLSKTELAHSIGKCRQAYSNLECGKTNIFNKSIVKIGEVFNVDPQTILFDPNVQQRIDFIKASYKEEIENLKQDYDKKLADKDKELSLLHSMVDSLIQTNKSLNFAIQQLRNNK